MRHAKGDVTRGDKDKGTEWRKVEEKDPSGCRCRSSLGVCSSQKVFLQ